MNINLRYYVSGSSKTLLSTEISPQGFKFCNSVEKYQILLNGNNEQRERRMPAFCISTFITSVLHKLVVVSATITSIHM